MKCPVCNHTMKLEEIGGKGWYICYDKKCRIDCKKIRPGTPFVAIGYGCKKKKSVGNYYCTKCKINHRFSSKKGKEHKKYKRKG